MKIQDDLERLGNWLFKRRGYVPFFFLPILPLVMIDAEYIDIHYGNLAQTIWEIFCITISFAGLAMRSLTVGLVPEGTSGRNTQEQLAESLNTTGLYSIVRHPLYLANFLIILGFVLFVEVWWFVVIYVLFFLLFYAPIFYAEECFLERKFGSAYLEWSKRTPIFLPNFKRWKKPARKFSWKMVLKREYSTFFGIIVALVVLKFFAEMIGEGEMELKVRYFIFIAAGFLVYITLRTFRKNTKWLQIKRTENK